MVLKAITEARHRAAVSTALLEEWRRYQSLAAGVWIRSMYAHRLVELLEVAPDETLRARIEQVAPEAGVAAIMLKDMHLIEAARASDERILSLDDRARHHFRQAAAAVRDLRGLCWVNPGNADEQAAEWLGAGAPAERHRKLGFVLPES